MTFDFARASMTEVIAEKMRRDALRAEGKPFSHAVAAAAGVSAVVGDSVVLSTDETTRTLTPKRPKMNKTETRYSLILAAEKASGAIDTYDFEGVTLKLGPDLRYTPDFMVWRWNTTAGIREVEFVEVKGPREWEDARVKRIAAATMFPMFRFKLARYVKGEWTITDIDPR